MNLHFDPCLHVPLAFTGPRVPADERRSDLVSLVDLFPTLCDLAGVDAPQNVDGCSMFRGRRRDAVFAENDFRDAPSVFDDYLPAKTVGRLERGLKSVRTEDYLYTPDSAGEERLYDLPGETDVIDPHPETLAAHRERVEKTLGTKFPPGTQEDDYGEAIEEYLRHLGYLE